ncbi:MAG TPA: alkaline phosphatase family protein [Acidimicrobiales bacterium]|nr:alkaline phosphatase family protein [Acidimicrobiales bacterium]
MRLKRWGMPAAALLAAGAGSLAMGPAGNAAGAQPAIPHYQHIFEIMMENTSYGTIIGNPLAPQINALAQQYGLATDYYGVTHPSEPNYVANIGGSYFGIQDDNQFYCTPAMASTDSHCTGTTVDHTVDAPSIADQLTAAGLSWKGYFQSLPPTPTTFVTTGPNANGPYTYKYPSNSNALYASKHNPFLNFTGTQGDVADMVPDTQLASDLTGGGLPSFGLIVPDQCHDMHGTGSCSDTDSLISAGDAYVGATVQEIMSSKAWTEGRDAIVVTWDEDDFSDQGQTGTGCCGADPGGGHVVTIVITNKGTHPVTDGTAYNHYSLLKSYEEAFGLPLLAHAGDADVPAMAPLFHP